MRGWGMTCNWHRTASFAGAVRGRALVDQKPLSASRIDSSVAVLMPRQFFSFRRKPAMPVGVQPPLLEAAPHLIGHDLESRRSPASRPRYAEPALGLSRMTHPAIASSAILGCGSASAACLGRVLGIVVGADRRIRRIACGSDPAQPLCPTNRRPERLTVSWKRRNALSLLFRRHCGRTCHICAGTALAQAIAYKTPLPTNTIANKRHCQPIASARGGKAARNGTIRAGMIEAPPQGRPPHPADQHFRRSSLVDQHFGQSVFWPISPETRSMARVILHIGTHKTGTTTIQHVFASNRARCCARPA